MAVKQALTLTQVSQDPQSMTSVVRVLWTSTQSGGSYNNTERTARCYLSFNGAAEQTVSVSYTLPYQAQTVLLDQQYTVSHNAAGDAVIKVRTWMDTNISAGVIEQEKTLQLTKIPVQSTISAANGLIGSAVKLAVNRKNNSYTHSIAYSFGEKTGYVTASGGVSATEVKFATESINFRLPDSFYGQIPNSKTGVCTLTLRTYSGSDQIGQAATASFTVGTDPEKCGPSVSGTVVDALAATQALTGDSAVLIRYHSTAKCTIAAQANKQATVAKKQICATTLTGTVKQFSETEREKYTFSVQDSRGYTARAVVQCSLIPYVRLTCQATAKRDTPTGSTGKLKISGNYFNDSFGAADNTLTLQYKIGSGSYVSVTPTVSGNRYTATVSLTELDYEKNYAITVAASDKLESCTRTVTLHKGQPVFDWAEEDFAFHVPVKLDQALAMEYGGTGRKNWDGIDTDYAIMAKSPNGAWLTAVGTKDGAFYAKKENGAPCFGTLPIEQGGTGAVTAEQARLYLGAAPLEHTDGVFACETFEELEDGIAQVYDRIGNGGSRFFLFNVNGQMYDVRIWRATGQYGAAYICNYNGASGRRNRMLYGGVWQPWEWPDPPMALGTEYRTTGRWCNMPVYTKLISFGALPNCAVATLAHGAAASIVLRAEGQTSSGMAFPVYGAHFYNIGLRVGTTNVEISTDKDYSDLTATVQIWYTKEE